MPDTAAELYTRLLNLGDSWRVREIIQPVGDDIGLRLNAGRVTVVVEWVSGRPLCCPDCGQAGKRHDSKQREWRHLDTCQCQTYVRANVPRVKCAEHGVKQVPVPWASPRVSMSFLFEAKTISLLREMSVSAVAETLQLSWGCIDGVMQRAVERGLSRRDTQRCYTALSVDETAFRKRHDYVTVVTDPIHKEVIFVGDSRKKEVLDAFFAGLSAKQKAAVRSVSMDMWRPYIQATLDAIPDAVSKIAFDRFHVAKLLNERVWQVLRDERRAMKRLGERALLGCKYMWMKSSEKMSHKEKLSFHALRKSSLSTARSWAMKEMARKLWDYKSRVWAERGWKRLCGWMARSRLAPMVAAGKTIRRHLWGIINAVVLGVNNGGAESMNSRIKMVKIKSRGFRNKARFRNAILFHLGGLDMRPAEIKA